MSFDSIEQSVQDSRPLELYEIVTPTFTWRATSNRLDVPYNSRIYQAWPTARSSLGVIDASSDSETVTVTLPAAHPAAQVYALGIPPRFMTITIYRYQPAAGIAIRLWGGSVSAVSFKNREATFTIPSGASDALTAEVPSATASHLCNHMLYDTRCTVQRTLFQQDATVTSISTDGKTLGISAVLPVSASDPQWGTFGEIQNLLTTEVRTIARHFTIFNPDNTVLMVAPFPRGTIQVGSAVRLNAGCDHNIKTCRDKFSNVINFGGHPTMPKSNVFYVGLLAARI